MNQCLSGLFATRLVIQIVDYLFGKVQLIIKISEMSRIEKINNKTQSRHYSSGSVWDKAPAAAGKEKPITTVKGSVAGNIIN